LPYPGGPQISRLASEDRIKNQESLLRQGFEGQAGIKFPRPMIHSANLDFSFSGLKTAVLYKLKEFQNLDERTQMEVARAFEDAAVEVLIYKTRQALQSREVKTLVVAGGVSANNYLKLELE